jgi:hypothetical protein
MTLEELMKKVLTLKDQQNLINILSKAHAVGYNEGYEYGHKVGLKKGLRKSSKK